MPPFQSDPIPSRPPLERGRALNARSTYLSADVEYLEPELEPTKSERQWETYRSDKDTFTVRGGDVIDGDNTFSPEEIEFEDPAAEWFVWVKITLDADGVVTDAILENGATIPDDTELLKHRKVAELYNIYPGGDAYYGVRQILFEPIVFSDSSGRTLYFPWKVTYAGETDGVAQWPVKGGKVYSQNGFIEVADITIAATLGLIYLRITRDDASREMTAAEILYINGDLPADDYYYQHRPLATITDFAPDGDYVTQLQFGEIRLWELMIVENGEFKLMPFDVSSRISYDPPP